MKIVIAPDSFKESLTAEEVAEAIKRGFQQSIANVECLLCPVGDGGEGTVDAIRHSIDFEEKWIQVTGPFGPKKPCAIFKKGDWHYLKLPTWLALENSARETKSTANPNLWYWRVDSSSHCSRD